MPYGIEHTQDLDVPCSSLSTIPYSETLVTYGYIEYEHGVKARLEHGIGVRSIYYGFENVMTTKRFIVFERQLVSYKIGKK